MNINWIDTQGIYRSIIVAADTATREPVYTDYIMSPWGQIMAMVIGRMGGAASADQLTSAPETLTKLEAAD